MMQKRHQAKTTDQDDGVGVAYAILCHANRDWVSDQFERLWRPENFYFYHVDDKAPQSLKHLLAAIATEYPNVFVIPSTLCSWAGFSLVDAMLDLVRWAVTKAEHWTHLIFLSEQHLPLVDHATIRRTLKAECSYFMSLPLATFSGIGRADVLHRLSSTYIEVPGVGAFRVGSDIKDPDRLTQLHHGSQWMILNRSACAGLSRDRNSKFWDPFRTTLLADEIAIQTWLAHAPEPSVHQHRGRNYTLVAAPVDGGNPDMTFTDEAFFTAVSKGFLFIRKRPSVISAAVLSYIQTTLPSSASVSHLKPCSSSRLSIHLSSSIVETIFFSLNAALAAYNIEVARMPVRVPGPSLFGIVVSKKQQSDISIYVLSGDMQTFKVAAISNRPSEDYALTRVGPYESTLVKVRGYSIWHHREIHLGHDVNHGIVTVSSLHDMHRLAHVVTTFLHRASQAL